MHEVLSTVAAIRSTADILVRVPDIAAAWRGRFHRNLHEEAERLSVRATAMLAHFEAQGQVRGAVSTPQEVVEAMFDAAGHSFPEIEAEGAAAITGVLERAAGLEGRETRAAAERQLRLYAEDAARLPMEPFEQAAVAADFDPQMLLMMAGGDAALVLRRLATLPPGGPNAVPEFGLAVCDAAGALVFRRRISAFAIPRFGAGCALWPLYRALGRPMTPQEAVLELPGGGVFRAWAVSQPIGEVGFSSEPVMRATMLLRAWPDDMAPPRPPEPVGPGCQVCPRVGCEARRAESLVG